MIYIVTFIIAAIASLALILFKKRHAIRKKMAASDNEEKNDPVSYYTGQGMVLGMCIGLLLGSSVFDNTGLGLSLGLCFGMAIGAAIGADIKKRQNKGGK